MKAHKLLFVSVLALGAVASAQQSAQPTYKSVEVTGEAAIVGGNKQKAREAALANARRTAVEQAAGVMVSSDTVTANSTLISDRIYANSSGYVRNEQILGETENGGVLSLKVKMEVGVAQLDKDLQAVIALIKRLGKPRMLIVLQENTIHKDGASTNSGVTATVLTEAFKGDGWTIIDPDAASGKLRIGASVAGSGTQLETKDLGEIAKLNVDYVLKGAVTLRNQDTEGMMLGGNQFFPVTGEYDFAVFEVRGRQQIGKVSGKLSLNTKENGKALLSYERTAFNLINARKSEVVSSVRNAIIEHLRNNEINGARVSVIVDGLRSYGAVQKFQRVLAETITGVREVNRRSFAAGKAEFDLVFIGSTDDLAERIGEKTFEKKTVSVVGVSPETLELAIAK